MPRLPALPLSRLHNLTPEHPPHHQKTRKLQTRSHQSARKSNRNTLLETVGAQNQLTVSTLSTTRNR